MVRLIDIFRKKEKIKQSDVEIKDSVEELDPLKREVESLCLQYNIIDEELKNKIYEIAKNQNIINYIKKTCNIKPVIVVANGPGFKLSEISYRKREDIVFCFMNSSPLASIFWDISPEYYIQADPLFFYKDIKRDEILMTREKLKNEVSWDMVFFVPFSHYEEAKDLYASNSHLWITPYHDSNISVNLEKEKKNIIYRLGLDAPIVQNVVVGAIYCLINSGYKKLELYGVNHSWTTQLLVNDKNEVCLKDEHFYDQKEAEITPWHKVSGSVYRMHEILRDLAQMFDSYWVLKDYAESEGVMIINKTKGSFIDAFERG